MAFWDKINSVAKSIGDAANDTIESTKLTVKIRSEKNMMESEWKKIGEYYYNRYKEGETLDEGVADFVKSADECRRRIEKLEKMVRELEEARVKREAEKNRQEEYVDAEFVEHPEEETVVCPSCGEENGAHMKYCVHCGAKLEIQVEQTDAEETSAGTEEGTEGDPADAEETSGSTEEKPADTEEASEESQEDSSDRAETSGNVEERPEKKYCRSCGKEMDAQARFCPECGTKAE